MCNSPKDIKRREEHRKKSCRLQIGETTRSGSRFAQRTKYSSLYANDFVLRKAGWTGRVACMLSVTHDVLYVTCDFGKKQCKSVHLFIKSVSSCVCVCVCICSAAKQVDQESVSPCIVN